MTKAVPAYPRGVAGCTKTNSSQYSVPVGVMVPKRPSGPAGVSPCATALTERIVLTWAAPTAHQDSTALKQGEIRGYFIYRSQSSGIDITNPGTYDACEEVDAQRYEFSVPDPAAYLGPWYFVVTAVDTESNQSPASSELGPLTASGQSEGPSSVDDWVAGNAESILVGKERIHIHFRLPKTTWNGFSYYKVYYDVDDGGGFTGSWTYLASEPIMYPHAPLNEAYAYKYKVTVVGRDGTETSGTTHDNGGAGYQPNETDQSNILADTVSAGRLFVAGDIIGQTIIGCTLQSTNWGSAAGSELDLVNGTLKLGGSSSPKFSVDENGVMTAVDGVFSGSVTITSGSGYANLTDRPLNLHDLDDDYADQVDVTAGWVQYGTTKIDGGEIYTGSVTADKITATYLSSIQSETGTLTINSSGFIKSSNYSAGTAGFKIEGDGDAEFNDVTVRGKLIANVSGSSIPWSYVTGVDIRASDLYIDGDVNFAADSSRHAVFGCDEIFYSTSKSATEANIKLYSSQIDIDPGPGSGTIRLGIPGSTGPVIVSAGTITLSAIATVGTFQYSGAQVFNSTSPTSAATLNLSSYVGSRRAMVMLRVSHAGALQCSFAFSDTSATLPPLDANDKPGISQCRLDTGEYNVVLAMTNSSGALYWKAGYAYSTDVWLLGWWA